MALADAYLLAYFLCMKNATTGSGCTEIDHYKNDTTCTHYT